MSFKCSLAVVCGQRSVRELTLHPVLGFLCPECLCLIEWTQDYELVAVIDVEDETEE